MPEELTIPHPLPEQLVDLIAQRFRVLGEPMRIKLLDRLRDGEFELAERLLAAMDDVYALLVTIDYPDAITLNLRRSTDVARSLIEKTRGDLSIAFVQRDLRDALDRHARELRGEGD